jgi:hypothetical protein
MKLGLLLLASVMLSIQASTAGDPCTDDLKNVVAAIVADLPRGWSLETSPHQVGSGYAVNWDINLRCADTIARVSVICGGSVATVEDYLRELRGSLGNGNPVDISGIGEQGFECPGGTLAFQRGRFMVIINLGTRPTPAASESSEGDGRTGPRIFLYDAYVQKHRESIQGLAREIDSRMAATELAVAPEPAHPSSLVRLSAVARAR